MSGRWTRPARSLTIYLQETTDGTSIGERRAMTGTTCRRYARLSRMRSPVLVLLVFALAGCAVSDGRLENAEAAYKQRDYSTAINLWRPLAQDGNAAAQTGMGILYENGLGVPKDETQAVTWYRQAVEQGDAEAEYRLGLAYVLGAIGTFGLPRDISLGLKLMKRAADQGHVRSMDSIGTLYQHGQLGIPKDPIEAVAWYRKAAELGYPLDEERLGSAYEFGQGVEQNPAEAKIWYLRAAEQNRKLAEQGDIVAQLALGSNYELGTGGFPKDNAAALFWYRKAAQQDGPLKKTAEADVARVAHQSAP